MLTPIPNSLGAGSLGLDFFPHGTVTSTLTALRAHVTISICVRGQVHPVYDVIAKVHPQEVLEAGILSTLPMAGETVTLQNLNGRVLTTIELTGLVEDVPPVESVQGRVHRVLDLTAQVHPGATLDAGILTALPVSGETVAVQNVNGRIVTSIALTGIIEEC